MLQGVPTVYVYISYRYNPLDRYRFPILVGNRSFSYYYLVLSDILWKCVKASNISVGPYQIRIYNVGDHLYFKFEVDPHQFHLRLHHLSQFLFNVKKKKKKFYASWKMAHGYADIAMRRYRAGPLNILIFKKLEGLWWVGEVVNHIWIYGSKVAEGSSAFQRRSCYNYLFEMPI